ncbi:hypothetical protein [Pontibacillus marinus]|uniref:Uncharacterized protein n=1 Tax=Pontibacillus marinus BH030004 = DSM 16465 TaxID=1385511 RepID=A0A0A5GFF1_9BACI|nr:hypothetical protein [Pontibacillus marinus]KGX89933.1 hypothetical protein N783_03110 [Pontibacillus marinus BH030004 = DSM 16465]
MFVKNFIYKLRDSEKFYLLNFVFILIGLVSSMILTSESIIWGQRFIIFWIGLLVYVTVFLGVDPMIKGIGLTLLPMGVTALFVQILEYVPVNVYNKWLEVDTVKGGGPVSLFFYIMLFIVLKVFKVEPYMLMLAREQQNK